MATQPTQASLWRIDLARELAKPYIAHPDVRLVLLGGSPAKGISDDYSDLDIVVYWNTLDKQWIEDVPLRHLGLERRLYLPPVAEDSCFELYYAKTLIVEFGSETLDEWRAMTRRVTERFEARPPDLKTIGGFLSAKVLHGETLYQQLRAELLPYPHELAVRIIRQNLGFFWNGVLQNQGLNRGELLFFQDAVCVTLKRLLTIIAAINHTYYSPMDPRWIEYEYCQMTHCPVDLWPRILRIIDGDRVEAIQRLNELIAEVFDLIKTHVPEIDTDAARQGWEIDVRGCSERPM